MEISLSVSGELAEAVADVLARFAPNGIVTEQGVQFMNEADEGTGQGPITVSAYVPVDERLNETRRSIEASLHYLGMIQPVPLPAFKLIADRNWMEAWKEHYKPIPVGRRLMILPAWLDQTEPGRIPIKIDPGMAFGTGTHPSTQLCLELMEQVFEDRGTRKEASNAPFVCIDVGAGSGILAIAALQLGATAALGVDIDARSIENARQNASANGIGVELTLGLGSVREIRQGMFAIRTGELVMANILAPVIIQLIEEGLADLLAPGGTLILGGILEEQAQRVTEAGQARDLRLRQMRHSGDWVALALGA